MSLSILKKIWRDLTERKARTILTIVGLLVGLWGVGSVVVAWQVLDNDLSENFTSTNPPAIILTLKSKPIQDSDEVLPIKKLATVLGIAAIENRPILSGRLEIYQDYWLPVAFWVVDDFSQMKVGKIFTESMVKIPPKNSFFIERDGLLLANWRLKMRVTGPDPHKIARDPHGEPIVIDPNNMTYFGGKPISLRLKAGQQVEVELSGTVHDPAQAPSRMEQLLYGYITPETAKLWTGGNLVDRLIVTPVHGYSDAASVRQISVRLEAQLNELGYQVTKISFPSTTEHKHQFQMNSILFLLTGVGLLALLVSVVLVLNLINGILTSQVKQIGILKAIGATNIHIASIYLGSMMILGMIASLIAIPLAVYSGYVISAKLAAFLNFDILTTELPLSFLFILFLVGTLLPMIAALGPIKRWTQVSVINALQHAEATSSKNRVNLPLPLPINLVMGIKNAFRKPRRLLFTAATVAIGLMTFMLAMNTSTSLLHTAEQEELQKRYDLLVLFEQPIKANRVGWMDKFGMVEHAETWKIKPVTLTNLNGLDNEIRPLKLIPTASKVMQPFMLSGNWLNPEQAGGVVINQRISYDHSEYRVGNILDVLINNIPMKLPIIGIMKEFGGASIYMREIDFRHHFPDTDQLINSAFITLKEPNEKTLTELKKLLEQHFTLAGVGVADMASAKRASRVIRGHLDVIVSALLLLALLMLFVSTLGMASGISTSIVERTREIGILRAIGGKPSAIASILLTESMTMAFIGWLFALLLSQPTSKLMTEYFGTALVEYPFDYMGSTEGIYLSLFGTIILVILATIGPIYSANKHSVQEAISYE